MNSLFESILPAQVLGIELAEWTGDRVVLTAPLAKNLNDKGTAFAGSIDAMLDLAGWSAITLALHDCGIAADVMIVKSETEYVSAIRADMIASAELPADGRERLLRELAAQGKCRIALSCRVSVGDTVHASMSAQYAVRPAEGGHPE